MSSSASAVKDGKVIVHFKHTGDAPILRTAKFKVPADAPFQTVTALLRKALGLQAQDPLVCARPPHACPLLRSAQPRPNRRCSSSTATAPLRRPRTSSCLTSPSASTWRVCSCSTTASPQRGADDANSLRRLASTHNNGGRLERRGSRASVPQAAEQQHLPSVGWDEPDKTRCPSARGEAHRCLQGGWLHSKVDRSTGP